MLRRSAISLLLGCLPRIHAKPFPTLDRFLPASRGCALLLDVASQRILAANSNSLSDRILIPPGSTLKPLSLSALLVAGKLRADESFVCPQRLILAGRHMDCSHPPMVTPMRIETALAYSCNCFAAHAALRFEPGELARRLQAANLVPGDIRTARNGEAQQLQALGEAEIFVTPLGLAHAYRQLALQLTSGSPDPRTKQVLVGLEGAIDYGTGQLARVSGAVLAGKTGSTRNGSDFIAWFAGFLPSRSPEVVISIMLSGRHGGSDAAPIAAEILEAWRAGRL